MKSYIKIYIFSVAVLAVLASKDVDPQPPEPTTPITTTSKPTTVPTPTTTNATTTIKTTTSTPSTTSSIPPTRPTLKPTPTPSPKPNPTPKPSPTPKPTPTTPPTPNPSPTPVPDPIKGNWSVNYPGNNRSCIVIDAAIQIEVLLSISNDSLKINVPVNANATGNCEKDLQIINLNWNSTQNQSNSLQFEFYKEGNIPKFELFEVNFTMVADGKFFSLSHHKAEFPTPLTNSYKCDRVQTLNLTDSKNDTGAYIHVSHLQFQAFRNATGHNYDSAKDCETSLTTDVVPIVVGCVLAALVIAVLVAYLVGRKRCQARGYLSM